MNWKLPYGFMAIAKTKTTTTAKLAARWAAEGKKLLLVAADTFRAAAVTQLVEWGDRIGVPVVSGKENAKPGTVVYDGMERAKEEEVDIVIIDTERTPTPCDASKIDQ